jgi:hypothetical protein
VILELSASAGVAIATAARIEKIVLRIISLIVFNNSIGSHITLRNPIMYTFVNALI